MRSPQQGLRRHGLFARISTEILQANSAACCTSQLLLRVDVGRCERLLCDLGAADAVCTRYGGDQGRTELLWTTVSGSACRNKADTSEPAAPCSGGVLHVGSFATFGAFHSTFHTSSASGTGGVLSATGRACVMQGRGLACESPPGALFTRSRILVPTGMRRLPTVLLTQPSPMRAQCLRWTRSAA